MDQRYNIKPPWLILAALIFTAQSCQAQQADKSAGFDQARERMVRTQIESRGIIDRMVLAAMRKVERHRFVPERQQASAYTDQPLPIGEGQTISQPYIVALMTELLELDGDEKVLEVGTGSGYQAAVLGELAASVFTIEIVPPLAQHAEKLLKELGYDNITVRCGDGYIGWPEQAPFDAIIITCAPPQVPQPLIDQLADGGRMVVPVGRRWQELVLIEKHGRRLKETSIIPVRFVPMTGDSISSSR